MASPIKTPIGILTFSDDGRLAKHALFVTDPEKAVDEFLAAPEQTAYIGASLRPHAISLGFVADDSAWVRFMSQFALALSRKGLKGIIGRDKLAVHANNALESLDKVLSVFLERLTEWYTLHYPELRIAGRELLAKTLAYGTREQFPDFAGSAGAELTDSDKEALFAYARMIASVNEERRMLEHYVRRVMTEIAPTTCSLVDPLLAAKMLAGAGSLQKLARLPASAIQLLGAEKALFRHLKKQGKSPKYGILFLDNRIQNARAENRGKVARIIASKLMVAARIDYYSGRLEEKLRKEMDEEIDSIK
ncbi:MAG: hypothetical protein HYY37_02960 [Candidatus Aenigmarchaeota archaeon]|nr:hypothetical protein [Candidatus Aenigmarchaeota archaeon]